MVFKGCSSLVSPTGMTGAGASPTTYTYDQAGNTRSRRPTGGTAATFTWDDQNRLKVWTDGSVRSTLSYNADGQRMHLDRTPGADFRWVATEPGPQAWPVRRAVVWFPS